MRIGTRCAVVSGNRQPGSVRYPNPIRGSAGCPAQENIAMAHTAEVREPHDLAPDLVGVKSRVSWSAIAAGAVIALACYIVLTLLFAAIGVSLTETNVRGNTIA